MQGDEQKISPIKQRILQFAESLGISKREFYAKIGVSRGTLESKTGITEEVLAKFIAAYPNVSIEWLLTGDGDSEKKCLSTPSIKDQFSLKSDHKVSSQIVPLYRITAHAGILALFHDDNSSVPVGTIQIPNLPPCDGALYVHGESMSPILKSGDIILYKKVSTDNILWGEMYLLAFTLDGDDYIAIKYIRRAADPNEVTIVSQNPDYSPQDIPLRSIRALALVKASVRFNTIG